MKLKAYSEGTTGRSVLVTRSHFLKTKIRIALRIRALFRRVFGVASKNLGRRSAEMDGSWWIREREGKEIEVFVFWGKKKKLFWGFGRLIWEVRVCRERERHRDTEREWNLNLDLAVHLKRSSIETLPFYWAEPDLYRPILPTLGPNSSYGNLITTVSQKKKKYYIFWIFFFIINDWKLSIWK